LNDSPRRKASQAGALPKSPRGCYVSTAKLARRLALSIEELRFIKRYPYRDDQEFRVVLVSQNQAIEFKDYSIDLGGLRRITLSPWMSKTLASSVKETLRLIPGCSQLKIHPSTLVEKETWKSFATGSVVTGSLEVDCAQTSEHP
jgi:hypothetical protein